MRKLLIVFAAVSALAAVTPASARPFIGFHHGFHHGWGGRGWGGPAVGFTVGAPTYYAYASCPLVRVVHYGPYGRVVRWVRRCY